MVTSQLMRVKCLKFRGDRHFYSKKHQNLSYEIQTRVWAALLPDQLTFWTLIGFLIIRAERGSIDWSPRSPLPWRRLIQWGGGLMGIEFLKYLLAVLIVTLQKTSKQVVCLIFVSSSESRGKISSVMHRKSTNTHRKWPKILLNDNLTSPPGICW